LESIGQYFYDTTQKLIAENLFTMVGGSSFGVDLVKYVIRLVPVHWAASDLVSRSWINALCMLTEDALLEAGIQLKTKQNPRGTYTPDELYEILTDIYSYVKSHCSAVPVV